MSALCAVGVFHGVTLFSDIFQLLFYWFSLYVYYKLIYLAFFPYLLVTQ